jgi:hypothetical protein
MKGTGELRMIRRVAKFETSDGKMFDIETEAVAHEAQYVAIKQLAELLTVSIKTGRVESVIKHVVVESEKVRDILAKYARRLPRPRRIRSEPSTIEYEIPKSWPEDTAKVA